MITNLPTPCNEWERLLYLSALGIDFAEPDACLNDLARLAATIAGTSISLVNLIDHHLQWSVGKHGIEVEHVPREESVCQYTILEDQHLEISNLSLDDRFKNKEYVTGGPQLKYYYGIPLTTSEGYNLGALCVMDDKPGKLGADKTAMLRIIANEIVSKIICKKSMHDLQNQIAGFQQTNTRLAHDIRGPIGGIIGIARLYKKRTPGSDDINKIPEVFNMIENSGLSLLSLSEEILNSRATNNHQPLPFIEPAGFLFDLKERIKKLYHPMAQHKNILFSVAAGDENVPVDFVKNNLLQICGNLISNAIKFTPLGGSVSVDLGIQLTRQQKMLHITVTDSGIGISHHDIKKIMQGNGETKAGTASEPGFGLGLQLVKHLVDKSGGNMQIHSAINEGTTFELRLPL